MQDQPDPIADPSPEIQTTPHNREAEESLLGAILIDPEIFNEVVQFITGDDFYIHRNRWVWNAIAHLVEKSHPGGHPESFRVFDCPGAIGGIGRRGLSYTAVSARPQRLECRLLRAYRGRIRRPPPVNVRGQ